MQSQAHAFNYEGKQGQASLNLARSNEWAMVLGSANTATFALQVREKSQKAYELLLQAARPVLQLGTEEEA